VRWLIKTAVLIIFGLFGLWAFLRLFNIDPKPIIDSFARALSGGRVVEFSEAFTGRPNIRVCSVNRVDTDGDGFKEWLVFYQVDSTGPKTWNQPCPDKSPRWGSIYDNDRGQQPVVVFPYDLTPPHRDLLGEEGTSFETAEIVPNRSASNLPVEELLIYGRRGGINNQLTIFKFQQNTPDAATPTDDPPRYVVIGAFVGSGGVSYDPTTKLVTVRDRNGRERSQLAVVNVYALHGEGENQTYMREPLAKEVAAPIKSSISFQFGPPSDILDTEFPEKIVLAFFQSLDQARSGELPDWKSEDFLAPVGNDNTIGNAARNFEDENLAYFFASSSDTSLRPRDISDIVVTQLQYFPQVEEHPATQTIQGPQPQRGRVDIQLQAQNIPRVLMSYEMVFLNGQWKINQRLQ
jgi:hypothetical protein